MFTILDRGEHRLVQGETQQTYHFVLNQQTYQKIAGMLEHSALLSRSESEYWVERLCRDMGHIPGYQLQQELQLKSNQDRIAQIATITRALHTPLALRERVITPDTPAQILYKAV